MPRREKAGRGLAEEGGGRGLCAAGTKETARWKRAGEDRSGLGRNGRILVRHYAMFWFANSQLTRFQNASTNLARALR